MKGASRGCQLSITRLRGDLTEYILWSGKVLEVRAQNFGRNADYPDILRDFLQSTAKCWDIPQIRSRPLQSTSFPASTSLVIQSFNATRSDNANKWTMKTNKRHDTINVIRLWNKVRGGDWCRFTPYFQFPGIIWTSGISSCKFLTNNLNTRYIMLQITFNLFTRMKGIIILQPN
jgi:hypothetical protein